MITTNESGAYVVLINDDNTMTTTQKRRIVHRSKLVDDLWFLVAPEYNGHVMSEFTAVLEYLSPVSHTYRTEFLTLDTETYNGYLRYKLPVNTRITAEAGEVKLMITFLLADLDENGKGVQRSRKITESTIQVVPNAAWSDIIPDCALTALDQRIIKMDAQIKALNETADMIDNMKADNIAYNEDSGELQLTSNGEPIGDKVAINSCVDEDGVPVVDFTGAVSEPDDDDDNSSDVVEF